MEQGNNHPQIGLQAKARELRDKAGQLSKAANKLAEEAAKSSTLSTLQGDATKLRDAAKKTGSGTDHLYGAADQLATQNNDLTTKATNVITRFGAVQGAYDALSKITAYEENKHNEKVTAVDEEYTELKGIYDGMLNLTKIAYYSGKIKEAAQAATLGANLNTLLQAATSLVSNVTTLRDGPDAQQVKDKFNEVKDAYNNLTANKESVKTQFDALNSAYGHIGSITLPDLLIPNLNNYS